MAVPRRMTRIVWERSPVAREPVEFEFTAKERRLINQYGYPFPALAKALAAVAKSRQIEAIEIADFELNQLIGDISRSINDGPGGPRVRSQLLDLCERLEYGHRWAPIRRRNP